MIDSYIIQNRKPHFIIKIFIFNISILIILVILGLNTLTYKKYFQIHSQILKSDSYYYLKVLATVKEVQEITKHNKMRIGSKEYFYDLYKIDPYIIYQDEQNYQNVYLRVNNLDEKYKIDGYRIQIKIEEEPKTWFYLIKNKKEE